MRKTLLSLLFIASALVGNFSSFAQTVTYDIRAAGLVAMDPFGCAPDDYFTCGGTVGVSWTSTGTGTVASAHIKFYQTYFDGTSQATTLNGIANNPYSSANTYCSALPVTLNLDTTGYNVGGVNTFMIDFSGACWVVNDSLPDVFAQVVVTYAASADCDSCASIWNGTAHWTDNPNWTNDMPDAMDSVIVQSGTLTVDTTASINNLTLENGANLVITAGNTLTITGEYTDNGGTYTVQPGGTLILQGSVKKAGVTRFRTFGKMKVKSGSFRMMN